ncbi:hypothetical protein F7725_016854 [Dissostichus mawsoni]|uniref:Uncharacterized protein n=1 Tax=Dissostichus mawsoni TaxID=36200 RepID=A0A7J5Z4T8_DISMA|nr:hypothetical protein F7725_016854 [Dissostichus mawsoni]
MFFVMVLEMRGLLRPYGFLLSRDSVGGSVARAREAKVSMIRFTHNICTAFRGDHYDGHDVDSELELKELGDAVVDVAAPHYCFHDTAEVVISPSLVPSPVTATTCLWSPKVLSYCTSPFSLRILLLNSLPSMQMKSSPGWMIPHLMAMALAVFMLSPVTMRTYVTQTSHSLLPTSGLTGSSIPTTQMAVRSFRMLFSSSQSGSGSLEKSRYATQMVLRPSHAMGSITFFTISSLSRGRKTHTPLPRSGYGCIYSLFEDDLRGSLAVHAEAPIRQFDDSAHGLPDRVEGVDFVKLLLWDLVSDWLVIPFQVQEKSQQAALCLVANLLRQTAFLIWGLEGRFVILAHLNRVGQGDGDSQRQPLRHGHHQHSHTDDEELDKELDINGSALWQPRQLLQHKVVNGKVQDQDDDCDG